MTDEKIAAIKARLEEYRESGYAPLEDEFTALLSERAMLLEIVRAVAEARPISRSTVFFHPQALPGHPEIIVEGAADTIIQLDAEWREKARRALLAESE